MRWEYQSFEVFIIVTADLPYACLACSVYLNSVCNFVLLTFAPSINRVTGKA